MFLRKSAAKLFLFYSLFLCFTHVTGDDEWIGISEFANMLPANLTPFLVATTKTSGECFLLCETNDPQCSSVAYSQKLATCRLYSHNTLAKPLPTLAPDATGKHQMYYRKSFCPAGWESDRITQKCYLPWATTLTRPDAWKVCDEHLASEMVMLQDPTQRDNLYQILQTSYAGVSKWWTGHSKIGHIMWTRPVEEIKGYLKRRGDCSGNDLATVTAPNGPDDCALKCDRSLRDKCVGFVFNRRSMTCVLKTSMCEAPDNANVLDSWLYDKVHAGRPPSALGSLNNPDYDIVYKANIPTQYTCMQMCRSFPHCTLFAYNAASKDCWCKSKSLLTKSAVASPFTVYELRDIDKSRCPYGTRYHDTCWIFARDPGALTPNAAEQRCRGMGGFLPLPIEWSQKKFLLEATYLKYQWMGLSNSGQYVPYVGLTDATTEGDWRSYYNSLPLNDSLVWDRWPFASGEPNGGTGANCARVTLTGMDDVICGVDLFRPSCETPVSFSHPTKCRFTQPGMEYNGMLSETASGVPCKSWNQTTYSGWWPNFPDRYTDHNYCRNPDVPPMPNGPWCIRSDNNAPEYCETIPMCPETDWKSGQTYHLPKSPYVAISFDATATDLYSWTTETFDATANPICSISSTDWCPYYFRGSCYMFYNIERNRQDANAICQQNGWHLIAITSQSEFQFIGGIIMSWGKQISFPSRGYMLGLTRNTSANGTYTTWDTGEPVTFTQWLSGEPGYGSQSCVFSGAIGTGNGYNADWFDELCTLGTYFICEIELGL